MPKKLLEYQEKYFQNASEAFTGFGEFITSNSSPILDLKSIYGVTNLRDKVDVTGTGSVSTERGLYKISTGTTSDSSAMLSSVEYGRYIAGFEATAGLGVMLDRMPTGNEVARWGYFDDTTGYGFGANDPGVFPFRRSGGQEFIHNRIDWNDNDFEIDVTELTIFRIPFRWYGSGPALFKVSYTAPGGAAMLKDVDYFTAPAGEPICENPNLPIRAEVNNGGDATDLTMFVGGRQFFVQGDYSPNRRSS